MELFKISTTEQQANMGEIKKKIYDSTVVDGSRIHSNKPGQPGNEDLMPIEGIPKKKRKKPSRQYLRFSPLRFYEEAKFLEDGIHFIPLTKEEPDGSKKIQYSIRNLNAYGFRRNSNLSKLHNCPVLFYLYKDDTGLPIFRRGADKKLLKKLVTRSGVPPTLPSGAIAEQFNHQLLVHAEVKTEVLLLFEEIVRTMPNSPPNLAREYYTSFRDIYPQLETLHQLSYLLEQHRDKDTFQKNNVPGIFVGNLLKYFGSVPIYCPDPSLPPRYLSMTKALDRHPAIDFWLPSVLRVGVSMDLEFYGENLDIDFEVLFDNDKGEIKYTRERPHGGKLIVGAPIRNEPTSVTISIFYYVHGILYRREHPQQLSYM